MARQRFIHPEIWTSEDFASLPVEARLLFIGMISLADDHGRGRGSPMSLRMSVFPGDNFSDENIGEWSKLLSQRQMAVFYQDSEGCRYYSLPAWNKFQKPEYPKPSRLPDPPTPQPRFTEASPNDHRTIGEVSPVGRVGLGRVVQQPRRAGPPVEEVIPTDSCSGPESTDPPSNGCAVRDVFCHWKNVMEHPKAILTPKRERLIRFRLKEGYSQLDLFRAVDGCHASPFHRGENADHRVYDDLSLICRDGEHVEQFMALGANGSLSTQNSEALRILRTRKLPDKAEQLKRFARPVKSSGEVN